MIDVALVAALFVLIWVAVLVPPAARGSVSRRQAFEQSLRGPMASDSGVDPSPAIAPTAAARRRQVLGGLLVAVVASLFLGLLPTFRIMLVVHLLLLDSLLAVVAFVVYERDRRSQPVAQPAVFVNAWTRRQERAASYRTPDLADVGLTEVGLTA